MKVAIVGAEGAKFTTLGQARALRVIEQILSRPGVTTVISGHCHLGGIDIWAEEAGARLGLLLEIYPPQTLAWEGGFKQRNLQIAAACDELYNLTVDQLPVDFKGLRHPICYHCARAKRDTNHTKSGGCWTALQAQKRGKPAIWVTIDNSDKDQSDPQT